MFFQTMLDMYKDRLLSFRMLACLTTKVATTEIAKAAELEIGFK